MAAMRRDRPFFSQYDDELADSDQTITGIARVRRTTSTTAASRVRSSSRQQPRASKSAFFSDTTTDDERKQAPRRVFASAAPQSSSHQDAGPQYARLYLGDIQFPSTRHILWDRRILAERVTISTRQILPSVTISNSALKEIYRLYCTHVETNKDRLHLQNATVLGYLHGETDTRSAKHLALGAVASSKDMNRVRASAVWALPVYAIANQSTPQLPQEVYKKLISAAQCALEVDTDENVISKLQGAFLVSSSTSNSSAQVDFQLECLVPPAHFSFGLIRNLPLLMTPLAAGLARGEFGSGDMARRSGYITLDRARKAVPLLKSDPLVMQRPIVGLWIYGISLPDAWDEESAQIQLADPYVFFMCLGYLLSHTIKDRVEISQSTFLVALYPCSTPGKHSPVSALPRFFECIYPEYLDPKNALPMDLFAQNKPCLAGVSTFKSELEFSMSPSGNEEWKNAAIAMKIPSLQPSSTNSEGNKHPESEAEESSFTDPQRQTNSSNLRRSTSAKRQTDLRQPSARESRNEASATLTNRNDRLSKSGTIIFHDQSDERKNDKPSAPDSPKLKANEDVAVSAQPSTSIFNNTVTREQDAMAGMTSGSQSCCKSQQLLTIQHQQILENQQRQLHEMQEQIAQLRRLLYDTRRDQEKEENALLRESTHQQGDIVESRSAQFEASIYSESGSFLDDQSDRSLHEDSMSSLELSSITNGSHASELSSFSSSMVGSRVRNLRESTPRQDEILNVSHVSIGSSVVDCQQPNADHLEENPHAEVTDSEENERPDHDQTDKLEPLDRELSLADIDTECDDIENPTPASHTHETANEDEDDDQSSNSQMSDRLAIPESYLTKSETSQVVKYRGGTNYTSVPMDMHSFCIPRINFAVEPAYPSDSEDEEIKRIERKYASLFRS